MVATTGVQSIGVYRAAVIWAAALDSAFSRGRRAFTAALREASSDRYEEFKRKYFYDPVGFARDCVNWPEGEFLTDYQADTMGALLRERRVAVRSLHGAGKTAFAAIIVLWYCLTRNGRDWKIITTASKWRQLIEYLWPEIHKWARRLRWDRIGRKPFDERNELQALHIVLETGRAAAVASDQPSAIEGAHAEYILYIFDEAKAIPDSIFDAAEGAFSGGSKESLALAISTPGDPSGRFYSIHKRLEGFTNWWVRHWNVTEALAAGRTTHEWVEQMRAAWGEDTQLFRNRVLGEFSDGDPRGIIPLSYIEAAIDRWRDWMDAGGPNDGKSILTTVGIDVGSGSETGDRSTLARAYDVVKIASIQYVPQGNPELATMETAGAAVGILDRHRSAEAIVDTIGIGAGTCARIKELGYRARLFWAGKPTNLTDNTGEIRFANWRAAAWWLLREMLAPNSGFNVMLPPDDRLILDLTTPRYKQNSLSEIQIEAKESIRKRLKRSTDAGDSVVMAIVGPILCDEAELDGTAELVYDPPSI